MKLKKIRRSLLPFFGGALIILIPILILTLKNTQKAYADWFNEAWLYRQRIDISNTSGSAQTDYQVSFTLDTTNTSKFQTSCDDVRVTDIYGKMLPYWVEENNPGCRSATTKIWTKVSSIPTSGATLYVYYGNPSATAVQDANKVFIFYDTFDNLNKWTTLGGTPAVSSSEVTLTDASVAEGIRTASQYGTNTALRVRMKGIGTGNSVATTGYGDGINADLDGSNYTNYMYKYSNTGYANSHAAVGGNPQTQTSYTWNDANYHTFEIERNSTTSAVFFKDDSQVASHTTNFPTTNLYLQLSVRAVASNSLVTDWVILRKFVSSEPTSAAPTNEENSPGPAVYWRFDEGNGTTTNDLASNNTGTLGGTTIPTWQTEDQCISGKCLYFDGTSSKITGSKIIKGVKTVSFWVRPNTIASQGLVNLDGGTHKINTNASGVVSAASFTSPTYYLNGNSVSSLTLAQNQWNFVTVATATGFDSNNSWTVGTDGTNFIKGFLDEVKIYPYARSAAQVKADYNSRNALNGTNVSFGGDTNKNLSYGLVGYWKMDETSGNAADSSGNSNTLTNTNIATFTTGKFGNATQLTAASSQYFTIADNSSLSLTSGRVTVSAWVYLDSKTTNREIVSKSNGAGNREYLLEYSQAANLFQFLLSTNGTNTVVSQATSFGAPSTSTWYFVVGWYDGKNVSIQVNGGTINTTATTGNVFDGNEPLLVGRNLNNAAYMDGRIDEARIYNRALSPAEVSQLYNFAPSPLAYWNFDEGSGQTANDTSGNSYTATLGVNSSVGTDDPSWSTGKFGKGLNFDGSNDYLTTGSAILPTGTSALSDFSVSMWAKSTDFTGNHLFAVQQASTPRAGDFWILSDSSYLYFSRYNGTGNNGDQIGIPVSSITSKVWHHFEFTLSGGTAGTRRIYVDGVDMSASATNWTNDNLGNFGNLPNTTIAGGYTGYYFKGQLDEIKIYNYTRNAKQVVSDMNAGHPNVGSPIGSSVGYWKFDEGYGTTANNVGNGGSTLNGTLTGMASPATSTSGWTNSGKFGKALVFDNSNDRIRIANKTALRLGTSSFTYSAWIKANSGAGDDWIISKRTASVYPGEFYLTSGQLTLELYNSPTDPYVRDTRDLRDGTWHFIAGVRDRGNKLYLYIDGVQAGSATDTLGNVDLNVNTDLGIGIDSYNFTGSPFNGTIDEVKIYNYALTSEEIKADYNEGSALKLGSLGDNSTYAKDAENQKYCVPGDSTSCAAPVGEWNFEEGGGLSAQDTSGNANIGTLGVGSSAPTWTTGKIGKALSFGTNSYASIPNASNFYSTSGVTISGWFKTSSTTATFNDALSVKCYYGVFVKNGKLIPFFDGSGGADPAWGGGLNNNQWHFFSAVNNNGTTSLYVDGLFINSRSESLININSIADISTIGSRCDFSGPGGFPGLLDNFKLYNYARTPAQIAWDYNKGGAVSWWKMDECQGGTLYDASGNGNNGTWNGTGGGTQTSVGTCTTASTAWGNGATGKLNASLNFDGTDDYINLDSYVSKMPTGSEDVTVSAWIKSNTFSTVKSIVAFGGYTPSTGYDLCTDATGKTCFSINGLAATTGATILSTGQWYHIAVTYDHQNVRIYINGVLDKTDPKTNTITTPATFHIGTESAGAYPFNGQIDDVRIYNYPLTATQIKLLYNGGSAASF